MTISFSEIESALRRHPGDWIHTRCGNRGGLRRVPLAGGGLVVVKMWRIRNLRERLKALAHLSNGIWEWRMHRLIYRAGIETSEPVQYGQLTMDEGVRYEVMAVEDLGETVPGLTYLKQLIATGQEPAVSAFEEKLIAITARFVELGILDIDHQLNNFIVDGRKRLLRIDFECARRWPFRLMPPKEYAEMLARLITSHLHAVQPDAGRSVRFTARLYDRLGISRKMKMLVSDRVNDKLARQRPRPGAVAVVSLP